MASDCATSQGVKSATLTGTVTLGPTCGPGSGPITIFPIGSKTLCGLTYNPRAITTGPDGALWFTNGGGTTNKGPSASIMRMTTSGTLTTFSPGPCGSAATITTGPDGALWFTNQPSVIDTNREVGGCIGRITTSGQETTYTQGINAAGQLFTVADGSLWFAGVNSLGQYGLGRITTSGTVTFIVNAALQDLGGFTLGPDGAFWFTSDAGNYIGRITTSGALTTYHDPSISDPAAITTGPDGALWFATLVNVGNRRWSAIGRISTSGVVTHYTTPGDEYPEDIASGPDGAVWFTFGAAPVNTDWTGAIVRITTSGVFTTYHDPSMDEPGAITAGPDGAMWFVDEGNDTIGRISTPTG
jgi:virginiamycin B lyase